MSTTERTDLRQQEAGSGTMPTLSHRQILTVLTGLMLGMLVAALSQTIVATALPTIVGELGGQEQLSWVVSATLLASTASTPIWGKLSDLYGRKGMFQGAIAIFLIASLAAGFSQNMAQLISFRAVQGLGVGGLMALSQAIMGDVVSPRERGRYQGYIGSVFGLATVAGPLLGGFLVEHLSWRWTFWAGIPVGLAALIVTERVLQLPFPRRKHSIDWLGAFFIVASVSALLLVLSLGGKEFEWNSAWTYGLLAVSVVMLALAVWQERRADEPIMPPHLFSNHTFVITSLAGFVVGVAMFGAIIFLPQYLQIVKGESPTASGLLTLPLMVGLLGTSIASGQVITRTGRYKIFPVVGLLVAAVGLTLMAQLDVDTSLVVAGVYMFITGAGIGLVMQVLVLATQNAVPQEDLGVATSGATFFRSLGGAMGVAVFGALLTHRLRDTIPSRLAEAGVSTRSLGGGAPQLGSPAQIGALPEPVHTAVITGFADALQTTFLAAAPFAVVGLLVILFLKEQPLRRGNDAAELAPEPELRAAAVGETVAPDAERRAAGSTSPRHAAAVDAPAAASSSAMVDSGVGVFGTVGRPDGTALAGAALTVTDLSGQQAGRGRSDEDGHYRVPLANGGTFLLICAAEGYQPAASMLAVAGTMVHRDITLAGASGISGLVWARSAGPVVGAVVTVTDVRGEVVAATTATADGRYAISDLYAGQYTLTVTAPAHRPAARTLALTAGEPVDCDVELAPSGRLAGTVRAASSGRPLEEANVTLIDEHGAVVASAVTGPDGGYRFTDLMPGSYTLTASGYAPVASRVEIGGGAPEGSDILLGGPAAAPTGESARSTSAERNGAHVRNGSTNGVATHSGHVGRE
jgi:EmrB/QacA subfamily drug resistance transporter